MSTAKGTAMQLTQQPEIVTWPETHYVYLEKIGPFQDTAPQAWQEVHKLIPAISEHNKITAYTSLYKVGPKIYRAGVSVEAEPQNLPGGPAIRKIQGRQVQPFCFNGTIFKSARSLRPRFPNGLRSKNPTAR